MNQPIRAGIEPLNFLRQAEQDLEDRWLPFARQAHPLDARSCENMLKLARTAPKFVLPRGGRVFNDRLRGLPDVLRLPFPAIVIEYEGEIDGQGIVERVYQRAPVSCPKRIVVACQHGERIIVRAIFFIESDQLPGRRGVWTATPYFFELSPSGDQNPPEAPTFQGMPILQEALSKRSEAIPQLERLALTAHATGTMAEALTGEKWFETAYLDMLDEISTVLELIEALSCSNVRHEALPVRKLNKAAARRGALPFDEYRILTVQPTGERSASDGPGSGSPNGHRSPREHLRRGHVRVYQSGKRVWVNNTVVNPQGGRGGRIHTIRDLRAAVAA